MALGPSKYPGLRADNSATLRQVSVKSGVNLRSAANVLLFGFGGEVERRFLDFRTRRLHVLIQIW